MWPPNGNEFVTWEQRPAPWAEIRDSVIGFGANDSPAGRRHAYLDLIAPMDGSAKRSAMSKMSGCALTVLGLWRLYGLDDDLLWQPYDVGRAVANVVAIAKAHGAWLPPETPPEANDVVLIGGSSGGNEHVLSVVNVTENRVYSVDGGQVENGYQVILQCQRPLLKKLGNTWIGNRRIVGLCRMGMMEPVQEQWVPVLVQTD